MGMTPGLWAALLSGALAATAEKPVEPSSRPLGGAGVLSRQQGRQEQGIRIAESSANTGTPTLARGRRAKLRRGNAYSITMAEEAMPLKELPKMVHGHPRLLARPKPWKHGLSVEQLRARAKTQPLKKWIDWVGKKKPGPHQWRPTRAFYYLATGDESVVPEIVEYVLEAKPAFNCGGGLVDIALNYDWIYNSKSVTDEQRRKMADRIADVALKCAKVFESGWAFDIWTHRGSPGWASDVLVAGLVLDDDHPEAKRLRSWGMGYWKKNYFRGWQHTGGCWLHGGSAYNIGLIVPQVIACWASAVEEPDVYEEIRRDYGNWLEGHLYYMMCEVLPDKTRSDAVAWDYNPPGLRIKGRTSYGAIARAGQVPEFYRFQRWLGTEPKCGRYGGMLSALFYDEGLDRAKLKIVPDAPISRLWGREGPGYVQMRSKGWAPDSTVIEFKCGDLAWTHTHPNTSNAFWIYHKGRLAVQGGSYGANACWHGGSGSHYFTRSIGSNTMLVFQPGEFAHAGGPGARDQVAPGLIAEPGGQHMPFAFGQTCFTFDEYVRRKTEWDVLGFPFEGGSIATFEHAPDYSYTYVSGDATMAYNNPKYSYAYKGRKNTPKVDLVTRSLAWLDNKYLVVFDRVNALAPSYRKAWLCHFQGEPKVNGRLIKAEVPGHVEAYDGDEVVMTWADGFLKPPDSSDPGRLFIKTFLPKERTIRRIGGDGYECWANGRNRMGDGHKGLKVDIGRWRIEVSPARPATFDNFLHLLYPTDTRIDTMPAAEMVTEADGRMVGLAVGGWLVIFGKKGEVDGAVTYAAPTGRTEHLVVDLERGRRYSVTGSAGGERARTVSTEGTLRFSTAGPATVRLAPVE